MASKGQYCPAKHRGCLHPPASSSRMCETTWLPSPRCQSQTRSSLAPGILRDLQDCPGRSGSQGDFGFE
eukprot:692113-Heterocapsa_arctica.AAC.1